MRRLPIAILGAASAGAAAFLRRRRGAAGDQPQSSGAAPSAADAARQEGLSTVDAPPPPEMPGPSVNAPTQPESDTERAERADAQAPLMDAAGGRPTDLVEREEAAAAAEAGSIGGQVPEDAEDPAMEPVAQAGGGVAEGFEAAEKDLAENAEHGDGHGEPMRDALNPERESDLSTAEYAEGNRRPSTEVTQDAGADPGERPDPDDPGEGPGISAER